MRDAVHDLTAAGPTAAQARGDAFQWFEVVDPESGSSIEPEYIDRTREFPADLVVPYGDRRYMSLSVKPDEVMLWQDGWGLLSLWKRNDAEWRRIAWRFDERGTARFAALTEKSIGRRLAVLLDNRVVSVPYVREKITSGGAEVILRPAVESAFAELLHALPEGDPNPPPAPAFGPVYELVLAVSAGPQDLLDLDTGDVMRLQPDDYGGGGQMGEWAWVGENHLDLGGTTNQAVHGLIGWDLVAMPFLAVFWDSLPAASLIDMQKHFLGSCKPGSVSFLTAKGELPETFVFRTREGGFGLLQILAFSKDPEGVRIRYKPAP